MLYLNFGLKYKKKFTQDLKKKKKKKKFTQDNFFDPELIWEFDWKIFRKKIYVQAFKK